MLNWFLSVAIQETRNRLLRVVGTTKIWPFIAPPAGRAAGEGAPLHRSKML